MMTVQAALAMAGKTTWASHLREQVDEAVSALAAEVIKLRTANTDAADRHVALSADLEAAHFVRDKIEHAKCQAALVAARREVARVTRLVEKALWNGVREGGRMVENGEIDVSDVAWLAFQQREGLASKGEHT